MLRQRSRTGASTVVLMLFLAIFVVLPLGLLGFEICRAVVAQQELHNITDSAALSGTAAMASAPDQINGVTTTYQQREQIAMTTALQTFQQNSILQTNFNTTNVTAVYDPMPPQPQQPALHNVILNILLIDQNGNQVAVGSPAATMTVQAYYTEAPIFASSLLPILNQFPLSAISNGGLPQLDVILCMDVSGSMDDQTNVWFVNRYWDTTNSVMTWGNAASGGVSGHGSNLYTILGPPNTGTSVNVYPPQNLEDASFSGSGANQHPFLWSETPTVGGYQFSTLNGLRSNTTIATYSTTQMPEAGMPPGNYDPSNPGSNRNGLNPTSQDTSGGFTDMVCDMGFPMSFTYNNVSYSFPDVRVAVEASRGNMESTPALQSACCGSIPSGFPTPQAGYFAAYWTWVLQNAQPIAAARQAAYDFFNTMNTSANCHFGLVCFSSSVGTGQYSVYSGTTYNIDNAYPAGGQGNYFGNPGFPNPLITLSKTGTQATEFANVTQAIAGNPVQLPPVYSNSVWPLSAEGATDIADALKEALYELSPTGGNDFRTNAKLAVVLFTDGVPNLPTGNPNGSAKAQATVASNMGVPIYTIGLSQNPSLQTLEYDLLGSTAASNGIAYISGNNATYVPISSQNQLDQAFQTIARSLCIIQ